MIERLAKMIPHVIAETEISEVKDEWRLYMVESERKLPPPTTPLTRVDYYWKAVFEIKSNSGEQKYSKLPALVKAVLAFQNGNAAVERSLSDNKNSVTSERTGKNTVNARDICCSPPHEGVCSEVWWCSFNPHY